MRSRASFAFVLLVACASRKAEVHGAVAAGSDSGAVATADASSSSAPLPPWVALVREERWAAAAAAIDALADGDRKKPEARFARARVALERGDGQSAALALANLESDLPMLAPEIARSRARAQALAGPFVDAGEWFAKHAVTNDDHIAAATAFMKAKLPARANAECVHVIRTDHKSIAQEAAARSIRLHTGEIADAVADARWLLMHGVIAETKDAEAVLAKEDPKHPLTQRDWLARARALADDAKLDDALHAIDRAQGTSVPVHAVEIRRARADAMMRARARYPEAATLYRQCSSDPSDTEAASDLLWSARALSRADRDDDAIARYAEVVSRFPKATEAAAATFYSARLELLHGRWDKAAARFDEYASRYTSGADRDEVMHLRAIAHFEKAASAPEDLRGARTLLEQRAGAEHDAIARGRMDNLAALAALKDGDRAIAIARFTDVARSLPLTWPALVARARLAQLGAPIPPGISVGATDASDSRRAAAGGSTDPAPLAVTLPRAVEMLDRIGLDGDAEEALHARESEITAAAPSRSVEALCTAYGKVDRGRRRMQLGRQIDPKNLERAPSDATRWAWSCIYPAPFAAAVHDAETKETLPANLLDAVMRQESEFFPDALSPARAVGVLQLLPETAATLARSMGIRLDDGDLHSPARSITLGAHYLHDLLAQTHGSVPLAVASYNAGEESVLRWAERMKGMELDAFVEAIPFAETRLYVVRVMESFARYAFLERGEEGVPKIELALR